jgi:hypothetical protein
MIGAWTCHFIFLCLFIDTIISFSFEFIVMFQPGHCSRNLDIVFAFPQHFLALYICMISHFDAGCSLACFMVLHLCEFPSVLCVIIWRDLINIIYKDHQAYPCPDSHHIMSQEDFSLPGVQHDNGMMAKLLYSTALSYSGANNCAHLEHITYCLWTHILIALTDDRSDLIIAPQWVVQLFDKPADDHGDTSLDITFTVPKRTQKLFPDFAVLRIVHKDAAAPLPPLCNWRNLKLKRCPAPILVEIKRPASCKATKNSNFE